MKDTQTNINLQGNKLIKVENANNFVFEKCEILLIVRDLHLMFCFCLWLKICSLLQHSFNTILCVVLGCNNFPWLILVLHFTSLFSTWNYRSVAVFRRETTFNIKKPTQKKNYHFEQVTFLVSVCPMHQAHMYSLIWE